MKNKIKKIIAGALITTSVILPSTISLAYTSSGVSVGTYDYEHNNIHKGYAKYDYGTVRCQMTVYGKKYLADWGYRESVTQAVQCAKSACKVTGWR